MAALASCSSLLCLDRSSYPFTGPHLHWGGVVLKSEDNADIVVLENYSVSKWDEENKNWTFDLYGTKKRDQTFHGRHKATGQHGDAPTTMVIEKRP